MIAAIYARQTTDQNVADEEKRTRTLATPKWLVDLTRFLEQMEQRIRPWRARRETAHTVAAEGTRLTLPGR